MKNNNSNQRQAQCEHGRESRPKMREIFGSFFSVVMCGLAFSPMAGADDEPKWTSHVADGQAAYAQDRIGEAFKQYTAALADAEKQKVSDQDPKLSKLLMDDIPDLIERICQSKDYEKAEELAMAKVAFIERAYGNSNAYILDAMQDLQLIYAEQKKTDMIAKVLMRYSTTTNTLREQGKIGEADRIVQLRKDRLQRQLKEQFERIQRRFEPVTSTNNTGNTATPGTSKNAEPGK